MSENTSQRPQLPTGFYVACPHCEKELRIHGKYLGARIACRFCDGQFGFELENPDLNVVAIYTHCPHCADELRAASLFLGRVVACKRCNKPFQLSTVGSKPTSSHQHSTAGRCDNQRTDRWYCQVVGQTMGPMNWTALAELLQSGQLAGDDPVRCGETGEWQFARSVASPSHGLDLNQPTESQESRGVAAPPGSPPPSLPEDHPGPAAEVSADDAEVEQIVDEDATFTASDDDFF